MRSLNRAMIVIGGFVGEAIGFRPMLWIVATGFLGVALALGFSRFRDVRIGDASGGPGWLTDP